MSDDDKFFAHLRELSGQHEAQSGGVVGNLMGATGATFMGMAKGVADMGQHLAGDPEGPIGDFAKSENKDYPTAEKAGRYTAEYGPLLFLPELGAEGLAAKVIPELPRVARIVGKGLEGTWKGAVGGLTQGDTKTGAEVGGGTAAATAAFMAAPSWVKTLTGLAALEAARSGGVSLPWGSWHMAHPLAAMAATALGKFPGLSGALGTKALGGGGGGEASQPSRAPWDNQ